MPVRLNSTGGGSVTLDVPATSGTFTVNLPAANGDVVVTGGGSTVQFGAGSAAAPSITFSGDTNTGIYSPAADTIAFTEGGVEAMRIDSSGSVGIGTASPNPAFRLDVSGIGRFTTGVTINGGNALQLIESSGNNAWNFNNNLNNLTFTYNASERMRIDGAGNVGIGTSSSGAKLDVAGNLVLSGQSTAEQYIRIGAGRSGNGFSYLDLQGDTTYQSGMRLIRLNNGANSSSNIEHRGTGALQLVTYEAGPIVFYTSSSERARITAAGSLLVNTTSPALGNSNTLNSVGNGVNDWPLIARHGAANNGVRCILANCNNFNGDDGYLFIGSRSGGDRFYVLTSGNVQNSNNSYGAISDARLKENIVDATPKLEKLNQVRVVSYNLKGETHKQLGVVAQELEQIFPGMVEEVPARDADGNELGTKHKAVKYSVFVPMLIKALQEQQAQIETLEARLAAVEAR